MPRLGRYGTAHPRCCADARPEALARPAQQLYKTCRCLGRGDGDEAPICISTGSEKLGIVLRRALNSNQRLILGEIARSDGEHITSMLGRLSREQRVPLSTLKLNARILRNLGLITFGSNSHARLAAPTDLGRAVVSLITQRAEADVQFKRGEQNG